MVTVEDHDPEHAFIHVPKTGGTSIETGLLSNGHFVNYGWGANKPFKKEVDWNWRCGFFKTPEYMRKHVYLWTHIQSMGIEWCNRVFMFAWVRNPWSRLASQYHFRRHVRHGDADTEGIQDMSFDTWIRSRVEQSQGKPNTDLLQANWLEHNGETGACINFIGRTENIQEDWKKLLGFLKRDDNPELPWKLKMSYPHYTALYTPELRDLVGEFVHKDCVRFGYDFDGIVGPGTSNVGSLR